MKKEQGNLNYVKMEEEILKFWEEDKTFEKLSKDFSGSRFLLLRVK